MPLSEQEIERRVVNILSNQMGIEETEISRDSKFIDDLNMDSLDSVEVIMELEDEFELTIPDEEAEKIVTVDQAIKYISQNISK